MAKSDFIVLVDDGPDRRPAPPALRWKVAVIDDDLAVHSGTRFALQDFQLHGRKLELLFAKSAKEGRALLKTHPDIAVVLLDVVMEHDAAGLELVQFIRDELKNEITRIILRTGQPGQAPERRVIVDYDINDYKAKTELTADKLFTTITAALRSYEQLKRLVETRRGLEIIVDAASDIFDSGSLHRFSEGVLTQLSSLIDADCAGMLVLREESDNTDYRVLAGSGSYRDLATAEGRPTISHDLGELIEKAFTDRKHAFLEGRTLLYLRTASKREIVVLIDAQKHLSDTDRALVEVFCGRLAIAFDNISLYEQLQEANTSLEERVKTRTRELSAANDRLQTQWSQLRNAAAFKSEVLGTVAHDLKNPLAVVLGRAEMLSNFLAVSPLPVEQAEAQIGHIRKAVNRLIGMVDSLIGDAMKDADDIVLRLETLDLAKIVGEIVDANRTLAERKEQDIRLSIPSGITGWGDPDRLREALDNIVSNAVKYSPIHGEILVEVSGDAAGTTISVSDSGPGMSPEDESRLFGRFQRLSAKPTGGENSTGLGLSIVKRIVDLHGGAILVDKGSLGGARFSISLPAQRVT
jgi:signal transduction histidine kinase